MMNREKLQQLLFIYNADSGLGNVLLDGARKILSPSTYDCNLCQITYGALTEKRSWKQFRNTFEVPMVFLHRDEFSKEYGSKFGHKHTFPLILGVTPKGLEVVVSTSELNQLKHAEALIALIKERAI